MLKTCLTLPSAVTVLIIPFKPSVKSMNRISFHDSLSRNCYMDVLHMSSWYTGKATVYVLLSHVCLTCCTVELLPVCLMSRNLEERAKVLNSVMAPREKGNMLGEMWVYGCPSL